MEQARRKITVEAIVHAPLEQVWTYWTEPQYIQQWNAASDDWHTPTATNDLRVDGVFTSRMEAKDKSQGFDFAGTYTEVVPQSRIAYVIGDGRAVEISFEETGDGVKVTETFETEDVNSAELQRGGWQSIMNNFKKLVESSV